MVTPVEARFDIQVYRGEIPEEALGRLHVHDTQYVHSLGYAVVHTWEVVAQVSIYVIKRAGLNVY